MTAIAGTGVIARALEVTEAARLVLMLEGGVVWRRYVLAVRGRWHTVLVLLEPLGEALGVFVLLVLWHGCWFWSGLLRPRAAFIGPNRILSPHLCKLHAAAGGTGPAFNV